MPKALTTKQLHHAMEAAGKGCMPLKAGTAITSLLADASRGKGIDLLRAISTICEWQDAETRKSIIEAIRT